MPFAQLLGWCFDDWRRQAGLEPPLPEERAVLVGGRDLDPGERASVDRSRLHESDDAAGALAALPPDAPLYVHVDTDVLDPSLTPDAGFPAPGGWTSSACAPRWRRSPRAAASSRSRSARAHPGARRRGACGPSSTRCADASRSRRRAQHGIARARDERRKRDDQPVLHARGPEAPLDAMAPGGEIDGAEEPVAGRARSRRFPSTVTDQPG